MGFVLSGISLGALITPFLAGAIYDRLGYHAVWTACLMVLGFDFVLQIILVEKRFAEQWMEKEADNTHAKKLNEETDPLLSHETNSGYCETLESSRGGSSASRNLQSDQRSLATTDTSSILDHESKSHESWSRRHFPAMTILLNSTRIRAAIYGCFTQSTIITSFDAILPIFAKRTLLYSSTGAGLIFLALTVPSTLGTVVGKLSDRYGPRTVSLLGFALATPMLALMGLITDGSVAHQAALISILIITGKPNPRPHP